MPHLTDAEVVALVTIISIVALLVVLFWPLDDDAPTDVARLSSCVRPLPTAEGEYRLACQRTAERGIYDWNEES